MKNANDKIIPFPQQKGYKKNKKKDWMLIITIIGVIVAIVDIVAIIVDIILDKKAELEAKPIIDVTVEKNM